MLCFLCLVPIGFLVIVHFFVIVSLLVLICCHSHIPFVIISQAFVLSNFFGIMAKIILTNCYFILTPYRIFLTAVVIIGGSVQHLHSTMCCLFSNAVRTSMCLFPLFCEHLSRSTSYLKTCPHYVCLLFDNLPYSHIWKLCQQKYWETYLWPSSLFHHICRAIIRWLMPWRTDDWTPCC